MRGVASDIVDVGQMCCYEGLNGAVCPRWGSVSFGRRREVGKTCKVGKFAGSFEREST